MKNTKLYPVLAVIAVMLTSCGSLQARVDTVAAKSVRKAPASVSIAKTKTNQEKKFPVYLTAYSFWDNTPARSAEISKPVIHQYAGGTGSYNDPITIAVGHMIIDGTQTLDYPAGTRFYLARLRRYAIVEDVCGDGLHPQYEACHIGYRGLPWLDIYIGGQRAGQSAANVCANRLTSVQSIVIRPRKDYPVTIGPLTESGCRMSTKLGLPLSRVLASGS